LGVSRISANQLASFLMWTELADETLLSVFLYLDYLDLWSASKVCSYWRRIASDNILWNAQFQNRFPIAWRKQSALKHEAKHPNHFKSVFLKLWHTSHQFREGKYKTITLEGTFDCFIHEANSQRTL
jgi:hypothetical protein